MEMNPPIPIDPEVPMDARTHSFAVLIALTSLTLPCPAATYYAASGGNDTSEGASPSSPWATLTRAAEDMRHGDTLLLRRGDIFRDSLNLSSVRDPVIGAWGPAADPRPVVSGSIQITGWEREGAVWVADIDRPVEYLYADSRLMTVARYPNTGWIRIDTLTERNDGSNTIITAAQLQEHPANATSYFTGAQVRLRGWSWWYETRRISSYDNSGVLALDGAGAVHISHSRRGWGFYIDNMLEELDTAGEFYVDSTRGRVYFMPPGGADPGSMLIEGTHRARGIILAGGTVTDICLRHQREQGLSISRKSTIRRCLFQSIGGDAGGRALRASWDIADSRIARNRFENNLNIGISWYENSGRTGSTIIELDTLINTGMVPGYGGSGTWHAVGMIVHLSTGVLVRNCVIDGSGYAGVILGSDGNTVEECVIRNAMATLNDGGAIYNVCNESTIRRNIISDTRGDLTSCGPWYPLSHGIWSEFLGDYQDNIIEENTVVRSGCYGIYLPNNYRCRVRANVLFDNAVAQLCLRGTESNSRTDRTRILPQHNEISDNICYAPSDTQRTLRFRPEYDYGTLEGNYFCRPFGDSVVTGYGTGNLKWREYDYTLAQWQDLVDWADRSAETDPLKRPPGLPADNGYALGRILVNETDKTTQVSAGPARYVDLDGNPVADKVTLQPYSSKVIVQADSSLEVLAGFAGPNSCPHARPIRRSGRIVLHLPALHQAPVDLHLYDCRGRLVHHRRIPRSRAGTHEILLTTNAPPLGSGLYRCVLTAGTHRSTWSIPVW